MADAAAAPSAICAVVTTVASRDDALALSRALVERGLVACAQVSAIDSVYAWQGRVEQEAEHRVVCKIAAGAYLAVEAAIRELHRYELPQIYAVPIETSFAPYRDWVVAHSSGDTR